MDKSFPSVKNSLETDLYFEEYAQNKKESLNNSKEHANTLLIITIDLGNGLKDNIEIKANDDPEELALRFITKNELDFKILGVLTENIKKNLAGLNHEKSRSFYKEESPMLLFYKF